MDAGRTFEWDEAKAEQNAAKHKVTFAFAARVFLDPNHIVLGASRPGEGEPRWRAIGQIGDRLYSVVFTMRGETTRLISARRTQHREERAYGNR